MSPASWTSLPLPILYHPSRLSQSTGLREVQVLDLKHWTLWNLLIQQISIGYLILHMILYTFQCYSLDSSLPFPVSTSLCSTSVSLLLPCRRVHQYHLSRVRACVLSCFSHIWLCVIPYTVCSVPGFSVHGILQARTLEGLPCPPPGDLPNLGTEPASLTSLALAGVFFTTSTTWGALQIPYTCVSIWYLSLFLTYFTLSNRL